MFHDRATYSKFHEVESDPGHADMILLLGIFGLEPRKLFDDPIYKAYPDRCAVYTEEYTYLPLVPGLYCSARRDVHTRIGRVFSYTYLSRNGRHHNPFLAEVPGTTPVGIAPIERYLFSFRGSSTSHVRQRLFNLEFDRDDVLIENTSTFHNWDESQPDRPHRQLRCAETMTASHPVLCPGGAGTGSIGFFGAMATGDRARADIGRLRTSGWPSVGQVSYSRRREGYFEAAEDPGSRSADCGGARTIGPQGIL